MRKIMVFLLVLLMASFFVFPKLSASSAETKTTLTQQEKDELLQDFRIIPILAEKDVSELIDRLAKESGAFVGIGIQFGGSRDGGKYAPLIKKVFKNSPAQKAGLKEGDEILGINGQQFSSPEKFVEEVRGDGKPGRKIILEILRPTEKKRITSPFDLLGNGERVVLEMSTAVLREDKIDEVKKLSQKILSELQPLLSQIKKTHTVVIKAMESGKIIFSRSEVEKDSRVLAAREARENFEIWFRERSIEVRDFLKLE